MRHDFEALAALSTPVHRFDRGRYAAPETVHEGERNTALTRHVGWLISRELPQDVVTEAAIGFNQQRCHPPLSDGEVRAIAASVERTDRRAHPERYEHDAAPDDPWLTLDFAAAPEPPDWIVEGLIERGTVTLVVADTGVGKSMFSSALAASMLRERPFLDRATAAGGVMVLDSENPQRVAVARLRGLLLGEHVAENERLERLRAMNAVATERLRIRVGGGTIKLDWLEGQVIEFAPDLLIIDTLLAGLGLQEVNDNTEAARVMGQLRRIAAQHGVAIVLLHHESKSSKDRPGGRGFDAMGARSWAGQADCMIRLARDSSDAYTDVFGHRFVRTSVKVTVPKMRDGVPPPAQGVEFRGEYNAAGALEWLTATAMDVAAESPPTLLIQVVDVLGNRGPLRQGELATALGMARNNGTLKRTLEAALNTGSLNREDGRTGRYFIPPEETTA